MTMFDRARHLLILTLAASALVPASASAATSKTAANTGAKDSACKALYAAGDTDPSLDMTSLGELPAAYEVGAPGRGGPVERVMLMIHGGGWYRVGQGMLNTNHRTAATWQKAGWQTVNTTYRACRNSLTSVLATYDAIRAQVGPDVPVCIKGESAGGQLALMVAAKRSDVACVIASAAPTDFFTIKSQGTKVDHRAGAQTVFGYGRAAFGRSKLAAMSPASHAEDIDARILLVGTEDDTLVPNEQQIELADMIRAATPGANVDVDILPAGDQSFVHGTTSTVALRELEGRVARLVAPFGTAPAPATLPKPPTFPFFFHWRL